MQSCICSTALTVSDWLWLRSAQSCLTGKLFGARPNNVTGASQPHPPWFHFFPLLAVGLWSNGNESSIRTCWWILLHPHQWRGGTAYWNEGWGGRHTGRWRRQGPAASWKFFSSRFPFNCLLSLPSDKGVQVLCCPQYFKKKKINFNLIELFPKVSHTWFLHIKCYPVSCKINQKTHNILLLPLVILFKHSPSLFFFYRCHERPAGTFDAIWQQMFLCLCRNCKAPRQTVGAACINWYSSRGPLRRWRAEQILH